MAAGPLRAGLLMLAGLGVAIAGGGPTLAQEIAPMPAPILGPRPAEPKTADVFGACNRGELVFTAKVLNAVTLLQTMSEPPTLSMQVTFDALEMLRGGKPAGATFWYNVVEGRGTMPQPGGKYLVVASAAPAGRGEARITTLFDATEANLALAKKAVALPVGWSLNDAGEPLSPWAAIGKGTWPEDVSDTRLRSTVTCAVTGRPALLAGPGITLTVEQVPPKVKEQYVNPFGDGQFTVTVTNTTDKPVAVPPLLTQGWQVLWSDSLVIIEGNRPRLLPTRTALTKSIQPVVLGPGQSVSTVVDTLVLEGVSWPRGGSRVHFLFCLGEKSAQNFFYYLSRHHDALRAAAVKRLKG